MGYFRPFRVLVLVAAATALFGAAPLRAQDEAGGASASDLAKLSQNPVGNVYNLPFQNNANFKDGDLTSNFLNIQPVIPVTIGKINLINRGIIPVGYQSEVVAGEGSSSGLGDITYEGLLSPAAPGKVIFGGGVALIAPTATETSLGKGKWQAGPAVIVLTMTGPWVLGALAQNTSAIAMITSRRFIIGLPYSMEAIATHSQRTLP